MQTLGFVAFTKGIWGKVGWFIATETGDLGHVHIHALVDAPNLRCHELRQAWREGSAQIRLIRSSGRGGGLPGERVGP